MKKNTMNKTILFLAVSFFCLGTINALAVPDKYRTSPDPVAVMADGVLVRPLGLVSTIIGSVFYVITLPFTIPSDSEDTARQQLVEYPAWFTFQRPIGNFGHRYQRENIVGQKRVLQETLKKEREQEKKDSSKPTSTQGPEPVE